MKDNNETLTPYRAIFEAIYRPSGVDALEAGWSGFLAAIADEPEMDLPGRMVTYLIEEMNRSFPNGVVLEFDHKTSDVEVAGAANHRLRRIGIEPSFEWSFYDPMAAEVPMGFHALHTWLRPRGYGLLNIDTGGDNYLAAIVERNDFERLADVTTGIPIPHWSSRPLVHEVTEDWGIDPFPDRPPVWNRPLFSLRWNLPTIPGQPAEWSDTFPDERYSVVGSETEMAQLEGQYRNENPSHEVSVIERSSVRVRDGAPESWFVVTIDKNKSPHLEWTGSGRFLAERNGYERKLTNELDNARAWRSYASTGGSRMASQTVYTLAKARELPPVPVEPKHKSWRKLWTRRSE